MKSTPLRGVKEYLKPYVYKQWKNYTLEVRPRTFCIMGWRVNFCSEVKPLGVAAGKPSVNSAYSCRD